MVLYMQVSNEGVIQFSNGIPEEKRPFGRILHRWKTAEELVLMSLYANWRVFVATAKCHSFTVFVAMSYVCIAFWCLSMNGMHSVVGEASVC
jgi:hypothetical protein